MKEIKITSNGIKQAIDDLVNENELLQDRVYKLEDILKEVREYANNIMFETKAEEKIQDDILEILDKENKQ